MGKRSYCCEKSVRRGHAVVNCFEHAKYLKWNYKNTQINHRMEFNLMCQTLWHTLEVDKLTCTFALQSHRIHVKANQILCILHTNSTLLFQTICKCTPCSATVERIQMITTSKRVSYMRLIHAYVMLFIICIQHINVDVDSCVSFVWANHQRWLHSQFVSFEAFHLLFALMIHVRMCDTHS